MIQIQNGLTFDCYYFVVVVIILFVKILKMIKYDPLLLSERKKSVLIIHIVPHDFSECEIKVFCTIVLSHAKTLHLSFVLLFPLL